MRKFSVLAGSAVVFTIAINLFTGSMTDVMAVSSPSGQAAPDAMPGMEETLRADFNSTPWYMTRWHGELKPVERTWADRSNVEVRDGKVVISNHWDWGKNRWVTGGIGTGRAGSQLYGRWDIRFRVDRGDGLGYAVMLYPKDGWPPEIDMAESGGGNRQKLMSVVHRAPDNAQVTKFIAADMTQWHTITVIWQKDKLVHMLDNKPYWEVTGSMVPRVPMWIAIQTQNKYCRTQYNNCDGSGHRTAKLEVDWFVRWQSASSGASSQQ